MLGEKIVQPPSTQAQAQMAGATTFACCNLYYDDDWIGDGPYTTLPFVPAGARIRFIDWGRNRANVLIEGRKMSIGVDFARKQTTRLSCPASKRRNGRTSRMKRLRTRLSGATTASSSRSTRRNGSGDW